VLIKKAISSELFEKKKLRALSFIPNSLKLPQERLSKRKKTFFIGTGNKIGLVDFKRESLSDEIEIARAFALFKCMGIIDIPSDLYRIVCFR
jgi:hypothetical protein